MKESKENRTRRATLAARAKPLAALSIAVMLAGCATPIDYSSLDTQSLCYLGDSRNTDQDIVLAELLERGAVREEYADDIRQRVPQAGMNRCEYRALAPSPIVKTSRGAANGELHFVQINGETYKIIFQGDVIDSVKRGPAESL